MEEMRIRGIGNISLYCAEAMATHSDTESSRKWVGFSCNACQSITKHQSAMLTTRRLVNLQVMLKEATVLVSLHR